jgi:hypothetical protein
MSDESKGALRLAIATGILAVLGTVAAGAVKGFADLELAKRKTSSDLLLLALQSGSPQERLQSLELLVETRLISDETIAAGVNKYMLKRRANPASIPRFHQASAEAPLAPVVEDARIFLLAGREDMRGQFPDLSGALIKAGFRVLGDKILTNDPSRPDSPEVRYFNTGDAAQAEELGAFMRARLKSSSVTARQYDDASAKPGYVELWLGKQ